MGRSGSSSQANQSTSTTNTDNRVAAGGDVFKFDIMTGVTDSSPLTASNKAAGLAKSYLGSGGSGGGGGGVGNSTINITQTDGGIANKALDVVAASDATNGEGFSKLLDIAGKVLEGGKDMVDGAGRNVLAAQNSVLSAAQSLENDKRGALDQKTVVLLGLGAAAVAAVALHKK